MADEYRMEGTGDVPNDTNVTMMLQDNLQMSQAGNYRYNGSTICQGGDVVQILLRPAIQYTMRQFFEVCTSEPEVILPETWNLCMGDGNFSCDSIFRYTQKCKEAEFNPDYSTTPKVPCTMSHVMQDDQAAILLLVGLVLIGILLGVAATVAVCLICPGVHRWANNKIRGEMCSEKKVVRASTISSECYAAIDESNSHTNAIRLRPVEKLPPPHSPLSSPDSRTSPSASSVGHQYFIDPVYISNGNSAEPIYTDASGSPHMDYEHLNRQNPLVQSHKYAHIQQPIRTSRESEASEHGHNYFTLEKVT